MRTPLLGLAALLLASTQATAVTQPPGTADIRVLEGLNGNTDGQFKKEELITVVIRLQDDSTGNFLSTNVSARLEAIVLPAGCG